MVAQCVLFIELHANINMLTNELKKKQKQQQEATIEYKLNEKKWKGADYIIIVIDYLIVNTINQFKNIGMQSAGELVKSFSLGCRIW